MMKNIYKQSIDAHIYMLNKKNKVEKMRWRKIKNTKKKNVNSLTPLKMSSSNKMLFMLIISMLVSC